MPQQTPDVHNVGSMLGSSIVDGGPTLPQLLVQLMLGQRRRRWANINPALGERLVFAEVCTHHDTANTRR